MESAVSAGCKVEVLHVYDGFIPGAKQAGARLIEKYTSVLHKMSKAWKFHFATKLLDCGGKPPGHAIKWYCNETEPSLLVIASRGLGSVKRHMLGSTSDYCVHHVRCPIAVVKKNELSMTTSLKTLELRRRLSDPHIQEGGKIDINQAERELQEQEKKKQRIIVFAVDNTDHSERACHWVLDILPPTVDLTILHVVKGSGSSASPLSRRRSLGGANNEAAGFRLLSHFSDIVKAKGVAYQHKTKLLVGKPAVEIAKYCDEVQPNLLVTASRGLRQLKRQLLGSVSSEVVHQVACPVLVYKDEYTRGRKRSNPEKARCFMLENWSDDKRQDKIERARRASQDLQQPADLVDVGTGQVHSSKSQPNSPRFRPRPPQDDDDSSSSSSSDNDGEDSDGDDADFAALREKMSAASVDAKDEWVQFPNA